MKMFKVLKGTKGSVMLYRPDMVNVNGSVWETLNPDFTVSKDLTFDDGDMVYDSVRFLNEKDISSRDPLEIAFASAGKMIFRESTKDGSIYALVVDKSKVDVVL